jgi:hypothetical protein
MITPEDQLEACDHGEEIQGGTDPIIEDEDDNDNFPMTVAQKKSRRKFDCPKFADLSTPP